MTLYKALKDVDYWGISAGNVYHESDDGCLITRVAQVVIQPLIQLGIIEEVPEKLTAENIRDNERFWYPGAQNCGWHYWKKYETYASMNGISSNEARLFGMFRTQAEAEARRKKIIAYCKELDSKGE